MQEFHCFPYVFFSAGCLHCSSTVSVFSAVNKSNANCFGLVLWLELDEETSPEHRQLRKPDEIITQNGSAELSLLPFDSQFHVSLMTGWNTPSYQNAVEINFPTFECCRKSLQQAVACCSNIKEAYRLSNNSNCTGDVCKNSLLVDNAVKLNDPDLAATQQSLDVPSLWELQYPFSFSLQKV